MVYSWLDMFVSIVFNMTLRFEGKNKKLFK